jgi:hypothetical protein
MWTKVTMFQAKKSPANEQHEADKLEGVASEAQLVACRVEHAPHHLALGRGEARAQHGRERRGRGAGRRRPRWRERDLDVGAAREDALGVGLVQASEARLQLLLRRRAGRRGRAGRGAERHLAHGDALACGQGRQ